MPPAFVSNGLTTKADYISALAQDKGQFLPDGMMPASGPRHGPGDRQARRQRHRPGQPRHAPTPTRTPSRRTSSRASPSNRQPRPGPPELAAAPGPPQPATGPAMQTPKVTLISHPAHRPPPGPDDDRPHANHNATPSPAPGPLEGIRVLDVSTVYAAPITAMMLGDYGADVIKVEHPRGDPARTHGHNKDGHGLWWKVISRNKRTVTLNLGHPDGPRDARAPGRRRRRADRELPPRGDGEVGTRPGPPARHQPGAGDPARDRLRPVRALRRSAERSARWPRR